MAVSRNLWNRSSAGRRGMIVGTPCRLRRGSVVLRPPQMWAEPRRATRAGDGAASNAASSGQGPLSQHLGKGLIFLPGEASLGALITIAGSYYPTTLGGNRMRVLVSSRREHRSSCLELFPSLRFRARERPMNIPIHLPDGRTLEGDHPLVVIGGPTDRARRDLVPH